MVEEEDEYLVFQVFKVSASQSSDSNLVTLKITCFLLCRLVESKRCRPILGKSACKGMGVVEIKDSDAIRQPDTSGGEVFSVQDAVSNSKILTKEQVIEMFLMMGLVCWKANTTSGSTNQLSPSSTLPDEILRRKRGTTSKRPSPRHRSYVRYSLNDEVTLQCDASNTGLGAALLQLQQPVSFSSRALTQTETRYAQIEKELLAIVIDKYIFGRDVVHVETDHKPLEEIFKKSLCDAPARLQRMLLRLQRYNLDVKYKKGPLMYIADTLSRAYLDETVSCEEVKSLELVDHLETLRVSPSRLARIQNESSQPGDS
ncbi:hypothetical protein ACROYT_G012464 [Oculina patagonica]